VQKSKAKQLNSIPLISAKSTTNNNHASALKMP
jgi:hypothetical protein